GFDAEGNLHVGGGDYLGGAEQDNAALVRYSAVDDALAGEPVDTTNPLDVRRFDPDSDSSFNYYDVNYNNFTGELYVREGATVYSYVVPEPTALLLVLAGVTAVGRRRLSLLRQVGGLQ
ncbi:MAG: PEP-CTERM sorting domain-containing protein, partial [Planctomycetota bacterium]